MHFYDCNNVHHCLNSKMHPPANCWHCLCNNYIVSGHSGWEQPDNNKILYFHHNVYKQFTIIIFIAIWISHLTHPWKKEVIRRIYHHLTRFFHSVYDHWAPELNVCMWQFICALIERIFQCECTAILFQLLSSLAYAAVYVTPDGWKSAVGLIFKVCNCSLEYPNCVYLW